MLDFESGVPNRFSRTEGRIRGSAYGVAYPSPFFDVAHTYLPASIKQMFRWCRYYTLTNPLIASTTSKMAEYAVTSVVVDTENNGVRELWTDMLDTVLKVRSFLINIGLFYMCYGNAIVSISYPFHKWLKCSMCGHTLMAKEANFKFRSFKFFLSCPKCSKTAQAKAFDQYVKSPKEIRPILWNPEDINIKHNDLTGQSMYFYSIPQFIKNDITMGKRETVETIPQLFIDAVQKQKTVILSSENVFHFRRPSILSAQRDRGWGVPLILPVLKDVFYLQILKKAQECVSPDTLIETQHGLRCADDVAVGDVVRTHTGKWRAVEAKWYRDSKDHEVGRKLTLAPMRAFPSVYSPNHPILSIARNESNRRVDTKDQQRSSVILRRPHLYEEVLRPASLVGVGDYILYPRNLPSSEQTVDTARVSGLYGTDSYTYSGGCSIDTISAFERLEDGERVVGEGNAGKVAKRILNKGGAPKRLKRHMKLDPLLGYILGWYAGDGSVGKGHIAISMSLEDNEEEFCKAVVDYFGVTPRVSTIDSIKNVDVNDVILAKLVKGLIPGRAPAKQIPDVVLNADDPTKLSFLKGLWEADGCANNKYASLSTSSRDLAYGAYRILIHFGCIATVTEHDVPESVLSDGRVIRATRGFQVVVSTKSRDRLVGLFAGDTELPEVVSGKSGFFWGHDYFASRVCAVEEVEESTYIDFKVEEDETFCTPASATKNSIALERIVPLSILFPQPGSGTSDPYATISLSKWREQVSLEIQRWRFDRNYMPVLPLPVGHQVIGGDGRALLLGQEIRIWAEHIIAGMGVPQEFVFGGLQYSGSNVSMRMLENQFIGYVSDLTRFLNLFLIPGISSYMDWPVANVRMKRFKMADDIQRSALDLQLNTAGKISDELLLDNIDYDQRREDKRIQSETSRREEAIKKQQIATATIQGEMAVIQAKYQARAQSVMLQEQQQLQRGQQQAAAGEAQDAVGGPQPGTFDVTPPLTQPPGPQGPTGAQQGQIQQLVDSVASQVARSPSEYHDQLIQQLAQQNPQLASAVASRVRSMTNSSSSSPDQKSAMKPLPDQKPPRRPAESSVI